MQSAVAVRPSARQIIPTVLSAVFAIWAEWALFTDKLVVDGVLLFAVAVVLFVLFVLPGQRLVIAPTAPPTRPKARANRLSALSLSATAVLVLLTWYFSDGNRFRPETIVFWVLAVGAYLGLFWETRPGDGEEAVAKLRGLVSRPLSVPWTAVALILVIVVAAFFRFYQINTIPAEMTSDHAEKLLDIQDILNGKYRIFFPRNTGREPLSYYMEVPFVLAFGLGHVALKALTASVSLLTVPVAFLIGREIVGARFGLLAAFFLAVSKWDVGIGRIGLRFPFYSFFAAVTLFFLLRALRRGHRNDYLLCGLVMGVGAYGYTPFRITPLLVALAVAVRASLDLKKGWSPALATLRNGVLCAGTALVVFIPLAHYLAENPGMFFFRALTRVSSTETALPPHPFSVFLSNLVNGLLMFNWRGDVVWITTVSGDPALDYISGGLFVLGVAWCLVALFRDREPVAAYLLMALFVFMLPSVTSIAFPIENPSFSRSGGNTSVVALLVAAPPYLGIRRIVEVWPGRITRVVTAVVVAALLVVVAKVNYDRYFIDFALQYKQSARNATEMASVIDGFARSIGSRQNAFLKDWPNWVDTRNVAFDLGDPGWSNILYTEDDVSLKPAPPGNKLYLVNRADQEAIRRLKERFPQGQLREQKTAVPEQAFLVYFVPGAP